MTTMLFIAISSCPTSFSPHKEFSRLVRSPFSLFVFAFAPFFILSEAGDAPCIWQSLFLFSYSSWFWTCSFVWIANEAHDTQGCDPLVSSTRVVVWRHELYNRRRYVVSRMHLWRIVEAWTIVARKGRKGTGGFDDCPFGYTPRKDLARLQPIAHG